jgi:hypothetical protein
LPGVYRREPALYREFYNAFSLRIWHGASQHKDSVSVLLACGSERNLDIPGFSYLQILNMHPERICGDVDLS